jgi:hypothetical protein
MGYVAKVRFSGEPGDEVMQRAEYYLDLPNGWIKEQGIGGKGVKEYPLMPIVAAVALAIAVIETNNPRNAIKALSRGNTRAIIIRLKPNEFLSRLAKPITRSTNE